jgi:hypothetical protein
MEKPDPSEGDLFYIEIHVIYIDMNVVFEPEKWVIRGRKDIF